MNDETITRGTSNVFADLGYADAEERQTRLRLVHAINEVIARRRLTQTATAEKLGVSQPKVSALANDKLENELPIETDIIADWCWDADMRLRKTLMTIDMERRSFRFATSGSFRNPPTRVHDHLRCRPKHGGRPLRSTSITRGG